MSKKRDEYIDQLLSDLKLLEENLHSVREREPLPSSFFSDSFDRIALISRSFHELELLQIGEMKEQMERQARLLSEADERNNAARESEFSPAGGVKEEASDDIVMAQERECSTERVPLPEYRDPRITEAVLPPVGVKSPTLPEKSGEQENSAPPSLNDTIQAPPALLDLRKGISLNDRFLFQRELFNNNRSEMNGVMEKLDTLGSFEAVESYLKSEQHWNFENQTVKEFLLVIKKGFE